MTTPLNMEIRELTADELDLISGGSNPKLDLALLVGDLVAPELSVLVRFGLAQFSL
jgi:hypothetical protein